MAGIREVKMKYICPCGATMKGKAIDGGAWTCTGKPGHTFKLPNPGKIDIVAEVLGGGGGIKVHEKYRWNVTDAMVSVGEKSEVSVRGVLVDDRPRRKRRE
jgi:hypothetical protein